MALTSMSMFGLTLTDEDPSKSLLGFYFDRPNK